MRVAAVVGLATGLAGCAGALTDGLRYQQSELDSPVAQRIAAARKAARDGNGVLYGDGGAPVGTLAATEGGSDQFTGQANWQPQAQMGGDGNVTLNLVDVPMAEAAKVVLADTLGATYVLDPAVSGSVTIQTTAPVSHETLIAIFETVLRSKGAALLEDNGFFKILPMAQANGAGVRINTSSQQGGDSDGGTQLQVLPLAHVSAVEMAEILKPIAPQGGVVKADATRNVLMLRGSRSELEAMQQAVQVFDVDWMKGKSFGLFRVEFADPGDVVKQLNEVFANEVAAPDKNVVRFVASRSLKSVLVISARREFLNKAGTWIKRLDALGGSNDRRLYIYHIKYRPAGELAALLQKVFASRGAKPTATAAASEAMPDSTPSAASGSAEDASASAQPASTGAQTTATDQAAALTQAASLGQAPAPKASGTTGLAAGPGDTAAAASAETSAGPSIVADEPNNSLLVMAKPREYEKISAILKSVDVEANQVLLEATILEVSLNDELRYGLRWYFQAGHKSSFSLSDLATGAISQEFPGFSYFLNANSAKVALSALATITDVNVVSSPSLMVLDNHKATLQVGDEVPIATQQAQGVQVTGAPVINTISFKNTGVILSVTPRISDNGHVVLEIDQEVSNVVKTETSGIDSPTIQQRKIHTTVSIADGEGLTLGGLIQERDNLVKKQVPLAGDIPVLGNLFKHKDDTIARTELLIMITPRVVRNVHQANAITDEFREQLNLSLRPDHDRAPSRRENVDRLIVR
jgi:general secretion pathway protein D